MDKIIDYCIVRESMTRLRLEKDVAEKINLGWQPLGGIAASDGYAVQAMVKYASDLDFREYMQPTDTIETKS